jgi:autotransporter-associated beta strand protein
MIRTKLQALAASFCLFSCLATDAATTVFFDSSQVATPVASGVTSDTISSNGYLFTYTRDKLFTGGTGQVIGRPVRVPWPQGVEAQAVTTPPPGVTDYKARITLQRVDGEVFDLTAFTAKLLANTAATGASIEIMPSLNGEDGFNDPLYFDASGYYGQSFSYDTSPNHLGSTALLTGFDRYNISLFVDFALTNLQLYNAPSTLVWSGAVNGVWDVTNTQNFSGKQSGKFSDGDYVTFDDSASTATITVAASGVAPGSVTFSNTTAKDYSLSGGPITGPTSLEISGGGHLTLRSANTYTGGTMVSSGTLEIANVNALPAGQSLDIGVGGMVLLQSSLSATGVAASAVPEPSALALLGSCSIGLLVYGWRRMRSTT